MNSLLYFCAVLPVLTNAHIKLTYPPARYPALDFLDNARTPEPCGVPKPTDNDGLNIYTTLPAGSFLNVSWFMSYPHQGGFRVQLLDANDQPMQYLTAPDDTWVGLDDQTKKSAVVQIPNIECTNCALRLERQANEWGSYRFWSCADINIASSISPAEACSGNGDFIEGTCYCNKLFSGERCEFKDDCWGDDDCFDNGRCIQISQFTHPRGVCYCNIGFYGPNCALVSAYQSTNFDESQFQQTSLGTDNNKMFWRVIDDTDELEVVLQYTSMSWVAIGWRPANYNQQCKLSPPTQDDAPLFIEQPINDVAGPAPATQAPTRTNTPAATNPPTRQAETNTPVTEAPASQITPVVLQASIDRIADSTTQAPVTPAPTNPRPAPSTNQQSASDAPFLPIEEAPEAPIIGDMCYGDWRWPPNCITGGNGGRSCDYKISWSYLDDTDEIEFSIETKAPSNWWTGVGFNTRPSMVGADMIIVENTPSGMTLRDMYSFDGDMPRDDTVQNAYTPTILGTHVNGMLRATFVRPRKTNDTSDDQQFGDQCHHLILPVTGGRIRDGQLQAPQVPMKATSLKVCISSCSQTLNQQPQSNASCVTEYRYPIGCEDNFCQYIAKWDYSSARGDVRFEITAAGTGRWTGIGLSNSGGMANSDIYTGWVYDGMAYIMDRFAYGRQQPAIDPGDRQNIYDVGGKIDGEMQTIWFRREVISPDELTDYSLDRCLYFLFPIGGGRVLARSGSDFQDPTAPIGYHDLYQPRVSSNKICLCDASGVPIGQEEAGRLRARAKRQAAVYQFNTEESDSEPEPETDDQSADAEPQAETEPAAEDSPKIALHPMDCMDMVIGSTVGDLSRVEDYWSVSRATPMVDQYFGGRQSITSAVGYEADGITTIMFRKKMTSFEHTDHNITNTMMKVVWAKGQTSGAYVHNSPSGLDAGPATNREFYEIDLPMYHGGKNRGFVNLNFYGTSEDAQVSASSEPEPTAEHGHDHDHSDAEPETEPEAESAPRCTNIYSYPEGCAGGTCQYELQWAQDGKAAHFSLETSIEPSQWTGVGFNTQPSMANADMILVMVHADSQVEIGDMFVGGYEAPDFDQMQDVFNPMYSYENGRLLVKFSRPLTGSVEEQKDVDLNQCVHLLYVQEPGPLDAQGDVSYHLSTPAISSTKICMTTCSNETSAEPESEPESGAEADADGEPSSEPETSAEPDAEAESTDTETIYTKKPSVDTAQLDIPQKKTPPPTDAIVQVAGTAPVRQRTYDVSFRITNELWDKQYEQAESDKYKQLESKIMQSVLSALSKKYGDQVQVRLRQLRQGSVIADLQLVLDGDSGVTREELAALFREAVQNELAAQQLEVEPDSVVVQEGSQMKFTSEQIRNFIIIAVAVLLFVIAIGFAICMILFTRRRRTTDFKSSSSYVPFSACTYLSHNVQQYGGYYGPAVLPSKQTMQAEHNRQFSQATTMPVQPQTHESTASNDKLTSSSGESTKQHSPKGVGETTYAEWSSKVASNAPNHQESDQRPRTAQGNTSRMGGAAAQGRPASHMGNPNPYVQYPNDPYNYYTVGGQTRVRQNVTQPPYRPY